MKNIIINDAEWTRLKLKLQRKYKELTEDDLIFTKGTEVDLISKLATRLNRKKEYIEYTLQKGLLTINTNLL